MPTNSDAPARRRPYRVLFLCSGNSARSQIAEAVLNRKGAGRFEAASAGSQPAAQVNPLAIWALAQAGIEWHGHAPRGLDGVDREPWDFVITVCDRAREVCPVFPGQPVVAHWGMPDPAAVVGAEPVRRTAFVETLTLISRRIDLFLALPLEKLERLALEARVRAIGQADVAAGSPAAEGGP
ncbi:MAG TPA: arsenate reductase ArsC [Gemmatimonadales bacterium]|nr:arsenate reductase ArsC [Gemmatimonadales bacterium]